MQQKIYISLTEAEKLVFNKLLIIPEKRLEIERAQKDWSIVVFAETETLIKYKNQIIILSSSVSKYEIPEKEENLFLNHFRVPKGLITLASRKFRDSDNTNSSTDQSEGLDYTEEIQLFKHVRRGLIQCYALTLKNSISKSFSEEAIVTINDFKKINDFNYGFIKTLIQNRFYPIKERNDGKFYIDAVKRFNWLGAHLFTQLPGINNIKESDLLDARQWMLSFKDKEASQVIKKALGSPPEIFFDDFEFIIGYYMASSFYEETNVGTEYFEALVTQLKTLKLENNNKVLFWAIFFQAIFKDDLDFLYLIPSINEQQKNLECLILDLVFENLEVESKTIQAVNSSEKQAVGEYFQLRDGGNNKDPIFISHHEKIELFENNFSEKSISKIGFDTAIGLPLNYIFTNSCTVNGDGFNLKLICKPKDVTFYQSENTDTTSWLNDLGIKTKPLSKLIEKNKKVLVGFFAPESYKRSLFKVYEWLLQSVEKPISFKAIVMVVLVKEEVEYIQSPEFQNKKLEMEKYFKSKFGDNTTILVKNQAVKSDGEIIRNLRHLLDQYNIKDIELINENIDDRILNWLLSVNNEFVIHSDLENYYLLLNK